MSNQLEKSHSGGSKPVNYTSNMLNAEAAKMSGRQFNEVLRKLKRDDSLDLHRRQILPNLTLTMSNFDSAFARGTWYQAGDAVSSDRKSLERIARRPLGFERSSPF